MRVMDERLAPGVQNRHETNLGSKVFRVGGHLLERLRTGPKQELIELLLVLQSDRRQLVWHGKDDVVVGNGKKFSPALLNPLCPSEALAFRAVPAAARVIEVFYVAAVIAFL